jgi:hypothetical protein
MSGCLQLDQMTSRSAPGILRKAAARTIDAVCAAIGEIFQAFTADERASYPKNSGYRSCLKAPGGFAEG